MDGDSIKMKVDCLPDSRLYLGTQSSTKVYRSHGKGGCSQETLGTVHANALAVVCPDPVVPFKDSRYSQTQKWEVHPTGNLILFDWMQPGRVARGEVFAYEHLRSDFRVTRPGGIPLLSEKFSVSPGLKDPLRCGQFGAYQSYLSIYLVETRALQLADVLEEQILGLNNSERNLPNYRGKDSGPGIWVGTGKRDGEAYMIRAMGGDRRDLQPLHDLIFTALADPEWLGFNPWERRW